MDCTGVILGDATGQRAGRRGHLGNKAVRYCKLGIEDCSEAGPRRGCRGVRVLHVAGGGRELRWKLGLHRAGLLTSGHGCRRLPVAVGWPSWSSRFLGSR